MEKLLTIVLTVLFISFGGSTLGTADSSALSNEKQEKSIRLGDFDTTKAGFSFEEGKKITVSDSTKKVPLSIDIILDLPRGLGANNIELARAFTGKAGILDMGKKPLEDVKEAPKTGYKLFLKLEELKVGHTYCVLTAYGEHYGKFHITKADMEEGVLEFNWKYFG